MNFSPLQYQLKEQTSEAHRKAEQHPLMQSLIDGTYTKEHLLQFLVNLYPIYSVVEQRLLSEKIKQTPDLKRTDLIEQDINVLIPEVINTRNAHLLAPLDSVCAWVSNCWAKPVSLLKAELYSRWLGDFYGGQMMVKTVTPKAMYSSSNPSGVITAVREILDEPNTSNNIADNDIVQEVLSFFDLHVEFFDQIYNGSSQAN